MATKKTAIDLFSGCGGLTLGLKQAGFEVLAGIELDARAREVFTLNHPEVWLAGEDIREVSAPALMSALQLRPNELDLLAGCPPCQGFSRLRRKNRKVRADDRNRLIGDFARFVDAFHPKNVMMENVPRLAEYHLFLSFKRNLIKSGYNVICNVLDVADFGVPQRRQRLVLLASLERQPHFARRSDTRKTVRDAIGALPTAGVSKDDIHDIPENRKDRVKRLISLIPHDGGSRSCLPANMQLKCHRSSNGFNDTFGRMAWDDCSPTITSGCTNPSKGRFLHPVEDRSITLREAALLQGFPINYKFVRSFGKEQLALMIGNALPPPFIAKHAKALLS